MDGRLKRTPGLYIAGFMGSGKTSVGRKLADRVGWDFVDVDDEIEHAEQTTIESIFRSRGEPEFRKIETEALRRLVRQVERGMAAVIALGGGAFVREENFEMLENNGISVWLDCPFEAIVQRLESEGKDVRPLARDHETLRRLYEARLPGYNRADYRVDANCDVEVAVESILHLPFWK
jgi:shikimate kinase